MCFKDRDWCWSQCGNMTCEKNLTDKLRDQADKWWNNGLDMKDEKWTQPPISFSQYEGTKFCPGYVEPPKVNDNDA